jgi:hypothetical protein
MGRQLTVSSAPSGSTRPRHEDDRHPGSMPRPAAITLRWLCLHLCDLLAGGGDKLLIGVRVTAQPPSAGHGLGQQHGLYR